MNALTPAINSNTVLVKWLREEFPNWVVGSRALEAALALESQAAALAAKDVEIAFLRDALAKATAS